MDFEVAKDDLGRTTMVDRPPPALAPGQARFRVLEFGFSANNITYAVFGDMMRYWQFFPAAEGHGRIPVWGFAEVTDANGTGLVVGERVFGYLPMSDEWVATPTDLSDASFTEGSPHRADLPPAYNSYTRVSADPVHVDGDEPFEMLFRPLFMTDFMLDDWLDEHGYFGARTIVLSSASSKTAFGLAYLLHARDAGPEVVGLTAPANVSFVESLDVYDRVLAYDDVASLASDWPTAYVDMSGNGQVRRALHERCAELRASVVVGGTHWESVELGGDPLPGPAPALFFAPDQIVKRSAEWGPAEFGERFADAWRSFIPLASGWVDIEHHRGPEAVERVYRSVLAGTADPGTAFVLSMHAS